MLGAFLKIFSACGAHCLRRRLTRYRASAGPYTLGQLNIAPRGMKLRTVDPPLGSSLQLLGGGARAAARQGPFRSPSAPGR